ncbi:phage tail protein I [Campylobacter fetus]|uniref:phage tail protein I n=1 Tax=Campylobacter fetus TaxID=196 RepID=UPI000CFC9FA3|nr:phage tail protein I [Campylobacter fetus]AVK80656.1 phage tail protein I [Campylobacter fetus subsp. testudinum]
MTLLPAHKDEIYKKLDELFGYRLDEFDVSQISTSPERIPNSLLPHLAAAFDIETNGASQESIRKLIKNAFIIKKGTVESIKVALKSFFAGASIEEWFEYGGEPYFFRVKVLLDGMSFNSWDRLESIVGSYKNVRSVLDSIKIELQAKPAVQFIGAGCVDGEGLSVYPYQTPSIKQGMSLFIGAGVEIFEAIKIEINIKEMIDNGLL